MELCNSKLILSVYYEMYPVCPCGGAAVDVEEVFSAFLFTLEMVWATLGQRVGW